MKEISFDDIKDAMGKNQAHSIIECMKYVPSLHIDAIVIPISAKVLRISIFGTPTFKFIKEIHGY